MIYCILYILKKLRVTCFGSGRQLEANHVDQQQKQQTADHKIKDDILLANHVDQQQKQQTAEHTIKGDIKILIYVAV